MRECSEAREQIELADERVGDTRFDVPSPAHDKGHGRSTLEDRVLATAERARWLVSVQLSIRTVVVAIVHDRTIIRGKDHQCVLVQMQPLQRIQDLSYAPVKLIDDI